jgi:hypothetical protein
MNPQVESHWGVFYRADLGRTGPEAKSLAATKPANDRSQSEGETCRNQYHHEKLKRGVHPSL